MSSTIPLDQFHVSSTHEDGLRPRPPQASAVDSPSSGRPTVADHQHSNRLLSASLLRLGSPNFMAGVKRSCNSRPCAVANVRAAVSPPSDIVSVADHHHWPRLAMAHPTVRSETPIGERPEAPPPAAGDREEVLTESDPLTELTRSIQSTQPIQQPPRSIPMPNLPKKSFAEVVAEVVAPSRASKTAKSTTHKYFLADSPQPAIGTILTGDQDYTRLWLRRIWYIQGYPMRIFKWTPTFTPSKESSIVPVWVSFPELPTHLFRKEVLFTVASMIGNPLQIDDATLNQSKLSKARACIELDLLKPRLEDFQIQICGATIV
ncbi:UNVERIFIED_CONTAM: hypothetical protein Sindi_0816100 [Sesamum indicum]